MKYAVKDNLFETWWQNDTTFSLDKSKATYLESENAAQKVVAEQVERVPWAKSEYFSIVMFDDNMEEDLTTLEPEHVPSYSERKEKFE